MYQNKHVLLIAGGGTLGTHVYRALLDKGAYVDVICLEDHVSENDRLTFYKEYVSRVLERRLLFAHPTNTLKKRYENRQYQTVMA